MKSHRFVDTVKIYVRAGDGGNGCASFRREKYIPHGGPNGGDGGRGGNVTLQADRDVSSLVRLYFQPHIKAEPGEHGRGRDQYGHHGADVAVKVPCGTEIWDEDEQVMLADLTTHGAALVVAKGGRGGLGNLHFVSSTHQAPTEWTPGGKGEERTLRLELKLVADAGLVGLPNAGKSSIVRRISHAHPKVAAYPFTTLNPVVGTVVYDDYFSLRVADIPGLIKDSHKGAGLGDAFLRHVERAGILVHVIDMAGTEGRDPVADYRDIIRELRLYRTDLTQRPTMVVANKMDMPDSQANLDRFIEETGVSPLPLSAETGEGMDALKQRIRELVAADTDWRQEP